MNALNKEKIYDVLRNYHIQQFPDQIKDEEVSHLKTVFESIQDKIISMILGLVNGRSEFVDATSELDSFRHRLENTAKPATINDASRKLLETKITQLTGLMALAKGFDFRLRPVRFAKAK